MKKVHTSIRLNQIMNERNLKQVDIIRLTEPLFEEYGEKISKSDLSQYVSGRTEPGQKKLFILGKALNLNPSWLMGLDVPKEAEEIEIQHLTNIIPIKTKKVPLLGDIACGKPILCNQEYDLYIDVADDINADFCVRAKGDSMINARIFDGDIVFCREQPTVENGEIAVVIIDNEATLKRFYKYENAIELRAENPMQAPLNFSREEADDIRILGKAIAFQSYVK